MLIGCSDKPVLRSRDAYCRHKPQLRVRIRQPKRRSPCSCKHGSIASAAIAQLGERQTEDLKVPGSIPGLGTFPASPHCGVSNTQIWCFGNTELVLWKHQFEFGVLKTPISMWCFTWYLEITTCRCKSTMFLILQNQKQVQQLDSSPGCIAFGLIPSKSHLIEQL